MEYNYYNNAAVMVVKIDFSNLPIHLRNAITNEIGMKNKSGQGRSNGDTDKANIEKSTGNKIDEEVVLEENNTYYTKQRLNDALIKNRIHDYVAVFHPKGDKVVIVQRTNAEQLGTHHCRHCGIEFEDKTKLSIHLRIHYNIA